MKHEFTWDDETRQVLASGYVVNAIWRYMHEAQEQEAFGLHYAAGEWSHRRRIRDINRRGAEELERVLKDVT